ncbi:MAG: S9 family peptidase [Aliidiomarina sp.]|uniref:S9 family peptidase n=1 Tax=Aliidiomarina sp. TaxID=1872439 RepID=UPI0025C36E8F|nr:S9 family peptidase [Aliidiomarina sp.]MCH8501808.1 S9 family peptidase [Aliidiomarina sp.]
MRLKNTYRLLPWLGASFVLSFAAVAGEQPGLSAADYYKFVNVSDVQITPDGRTMVFVKTTVADDKRSRHNTLWMSRDGAEPVQLTRSQSDFAPQFSPDGQTLLFRSGRENGTALYQLSMQGGEAQELLRLEQGSIQSVQWRPDGDELLLSISLDPAVTDPLTKAEKEDKPDVTVITDAVYKRQGGYLNENRSGLWTYSFAEQKLTSVTGDSEWHEGSASYSPNGACIAFASNRHPLAREGYFSSSIFVRCGDQENELASPQGHASNPVWTGNNSIAYVYRESNYAAPALHLYDLRNDSFRTLADRMDHSPSGLQAALGSLWFTADDRGSRPLFRVDLDVGGYSQVAGEGYSFSDVVFAENGTVAFIAHNEVIPPQVMRAHSIASLRDRETAVIAQFNRDYLNTTALQRYQVFATENEHGDRLDVFFLPPLNRQEGESYPVVLNIKGGPGGMWGHQWFPEMQLLSARGYAVVFVNYRGSSGYGHDHASQVRLDYGGADYRDNIYALDAALDRFNWLDPERQYITGGSHGGFLTNWATTQTERFRAAVTQRSVSNWISEAGTQAFPPLSMMEEFGGTIWQNFDYYWGRSPLKYADRVKTPTLIIHSNHDHITPIGQGEEWFYALKANDVDVELVVYDREGHGLSRSGRPINLVDRLERIVEWFDRHNP